MQIDQGSKAGDSSPDYSLYVVHYSKMPHSYVLHDIPEFLLKNTVAGGTFLKVGQKYETILLFKRE